MKIAILGNSITKHGFCEDVGWYANYGMAASSKEKDFAHILVSKFNKIEPCQFLIENVADFELFFEKPYGKDGKRLDDFNQDKTDFFSIEKNYDIYIKFQPDIVIFAIGENVAPLDSEERRQHFYDELIHFYKAMTQKEGAKLFVRSCFWPDTIKDRILKLSCDDFGGTFIDLSQEGGQKKYYALDGRKFWHTGVANHPGDLGMKMIADKIWDAVEKNIK